ncbi:hypothetical protein K7I13_00550 [Brucepastera parasyntrophica]|uniref:cytidylyltransferase domain-containing protein n=1 Tax=Brucepastera parasyntrophica TaxID=2880008 RepID=UPI00210B8041|nr:hypothetical protein [Brucepastera parasyntrophica]ULQ59879.1 hypothetical protein K7I13_00550 [Brucepastera parasyntrophica]
MLGLGIIIQARTGSSRLPNKLILSFYKNDSLIDILLARLKNTFPGLPVILATTTSPSDSVLVEKAKTHGIDYFQGSESNVLQRFIDCGEEKKIHNIIRICADNPFLSMNYLSFLINNLGDFDYVSFKRKDGTPSIKTHYGFWTEFVRLKSLKKIQKMTVDTLYLEHVTNYIYTHPESFSIQWFPVSEQIEKLPIRLTVDTMTDFVLAKEIYKSLSDANMAIEPENILPIIYNNEKYLSTMQEQIFRNSK